MPPFSDSWSHLPPELVLTIADHPHSTPLDTLRLRSICHSWRVSIPSDRLDHSSIWALQIPFPGNLAGHYTLTRSIIVYIQPAGKDSVFDSKLGSMVKVEEFEDGKLRALDPVSTVRVSGFGGKVLNLVDLRVLEIARSFRFDFLKVKELNENVTVHEIRYVIPKKVVVDCMDGDVGVGDLVFGIFERGSLMWIRVGEEEEEKWGDVQEWQIGAMFDDVVFRKGDRNGKDSEEGKEGRFYAVDDGGGMVVVDRNLNVEIVPWSGGHPLSRVDQKYLVEAGGRLYLVNKHLSQREEDVGGCSEDSAMGRVSDEDEGCRVWFEVYCFKDAEKEWVQVYSLHEWAFFVADDCSFSVVARDCPPYQKDCIYYSDYDVGDSTLQSVCRVFDLKKCFFHQPMDRGDHSTYFCPPQLISA